MFWIFSVCAWTFRYLNNLRKGELLSPPPAKAGKGWKLFSRNSLISSITVNSNVPRACCLLLLSVCLCVCVCTENISLTHLHQETWSNLHEVGGMRVVQSSRKKPERTKQPEPELNILSAALLLCAAAVKGGLGHQLKPLMAKCCRHLLSVCALDMVLARSRSRNSKDAVAGDRNSRYGPVNCTVRP